MALLRPKTLNFVTSNKNKLKEVKAILGGVIEIQNHSPELVEIQGTVDEIARHKCQQAAIAVSCLQRMFRSADFNIEKENENEKLIDWLTERFCRSMDLLSQKTRLLSSTL